MVSISFLAKGASLLAIALSADYASSVHAAALCPSGDDTPAPTTTTATPTSTTVTPAPTATSVAPTPTPTTAAPTPTPTTAAPTPAPSPATQHFEFYRISWYGGSSIPVEAESDICYNLRQCSSFGVSSLQWADPSAPLAGAYFYSSFDCSGTSLVESVPDNSYGGFDHLGVNDKLIMSFVKLPYWEGDLEAWKPNPSKTRFVSRVDNGSSSQKLCAREPRNPVGDRYVTRVRHGRLQDGVRRRLHDGRAQRPALCVCKIFKSGSVFSAEDFASEIAKTIDIVDRFNEKNVIDRDIWVNRPQVWTASPGSVHAGEKGLIEPMIDNFEKFNSNSGWSPANATVWSNCMQALSHYSYHTTDRRAMLCDLQGAVYRDGFIITDPAIMSTTQEYGPTDLGPKGISTFFARHRCNSFCRQHWIFPNDTRAYFPMKKGSSMEQHLPTRQSRAPLTQLNQIGEEDEYA